jgi:hypothetical protein
MSRHELDLAESLDRPDDLTYVFKLRIWIWGQVLQYDVF